MLKTRTGQVVTEEMIEALAREAEAGYDPETLRPRRTGRPSLGEGTSPRVQFRVDAATYTLLQARARAEQRDISDIARAALERYLRGETELPETGHGH
ncbi:MAG: CopG family transcriptional regulator [Thermomicrobiales bacterium]